MVILSLYCASIQEVFSLLCEHPVLELESLSFVMPECEVVEELSDHVRFCFGFCLDSLLLLALILDAKDDLEELVELDLHRAIVIVLLHKLHHLFHRVDEAETDQWHTQLLRTDRARTIKVQVFKALAQLLDLIILELQPVRFATVLHPYATFLFSAVKDLGWHCTLHLLAPADLFVCFIKPLFQLFW